jgi:hypothetical protein
MISRTCRPDGAGDLFGCRFYKDVAPTALQAVEETLSETTANAMVRA